MHIVKAEMGQHIGTGLAQVIAEELEVKWDDMRLDSPLEPGYAHARAWKACVLGQSCVYGWCADVEATMRTVIKEATLALLLDENDSDVHRILAAVNLLRRDYDKALYHQERALALNPNDDLIVVQQGEVRSMEKSGA